MNENAHIEGWKAQTEYCAEYVHGDSRWGLNFFAVDECDAKLKIESIRNSVHLLGQLEARIPLE